MSTFSHAADYHHLGQSTYGTFGRIEDLFWTDNTTTPDYYIWDPPGTTTPRTRYVKIQTTCEECTSAERKDTMSNKISWNLYTVYVIDKKDKIIENKMNIVQKSEKDAMMRAAIKLGLEEGDLDECVIVAQCVKQNIIIEDK